MTVIFRPALMIILSIATSMQGQRAAAQSPIDLPFLEDAPADSFSNTAPAAPIPWKEGQRPISIREATGLDLATQMGLKLNGQGFGLQGIFLQRLLGILSAAQTVELQRWQGEYDDSFEGEVRGSLGFQLSPKEHYLFGPFLHVKAGYETWQKLDVSESNAVAGHDIGLDIKLTRNFWLTLARSDLYYGKDIERTSYRRKVKDRHYSSTEAYFTLAF
ncbi:MAG: hypothetical protein ACOH5I_02150 [Oligoflexus sp.]